MILVMYSRIGYYTFVLHVAALFPLLLPSSCEVRDSLYRQSRSSNGDTYNLLSDGKVIVLTFVDASGFLQECAVIKDNSTIPKQLFKEVVASKTNTNLLFQSIEMDVRKLGRKCRKYIRDLKRKKQEERNAAEIRFLDRLKLDEPLSGTKWCSRIGRPQYFRGIVEKAVLDACCKEFHTNQDTIPPFTFRHHYFNALPWSITSCENSRKFQKCLRDEGSPESSWLREAFFDVLKLPCYQLSEQEKCAEYTPWYDACKTKEKKKIAIESAINNNND